MPEQEPEKTPLIWGLAAISMGAFIVLQAVGVVPSSGMHAPAWIGALGGLIFVVGGVAISIQALGGAPVATGELPAGAPTWMRVVQHLGALFIFGAFAMIGSWIAFGPGERDVAMSVGGFQGPASGLIGRTAFGFCAVITWLCFAAVLVSALRRLDCRRAPSPQT